MEATMVTKARAGGVVQVTVPELHEGETVEVRVTREDPATPRESVFDLLKEFRDRKPLFKTGEEVDAYINEERDSWER